MISFPSPLFSLRVRGRKQWTFESLCEQPKLSGEVWAGGLNPTGSRLQWKVRGMRAAEARRRGARARVPGGGGGNLCLFNYSPRLVGPRPHLAFC